MLSFLFPTFHHPFPFIQTGYLECREGYPNIFGLCSLFTGIGGLHFLTLKEQEQKDFHRASFYLNLLYLNKLIRAFSCHFPLVKD